MGLSLPKNPSIYISLPLRIHIHYAVLETKNKAGDKNLPISDSTAKTSVPLVSCTASAATEPSFVLVAPGFPSCFVYQSVFVSKLKTDHVHRIHRGTCTVYRTLQNVIQQQLSLGFPVTAQYHISSYFLISYHKSLLKWPPTEQKGMLISIQK